ncbi:MAG: dinitrogenase iron-molybdenum cofactor biosynthesis protein [Deltaproteobacteria bacterium]|nr:dinitrogenase iron-molybdenum cofactor biosynthesis protein [Deltaproteobacteria bacterium]MBW2015509.1 dinitrogenase iron-molybdenum cofactor biosynthesis protein [Deltaproteobacteria bacterium]MBW2303930.1 dinitrogenase iron-molybdenum cofactor biosynthesis protein [Deltaproteobacteria bacterium]
MKIAIPIWEDKVSPVLDTASRLLIVEEKNGKESSRFEIFLDEENLSSRCLRMKGLGVDLLICGAVSSAFSRLLASEGIALIQEISGRAEEVLKAYFQGELLHGDFFMPGCRRNGSRRCRRGGGTRQKGCARHLQSGSRAEKGGTIH